DPRVGQVVGFWIRAWVRVEAKLDRRLGDDRSRSRPAVDAHAFDQRRDGDLVTSDLEANCLLRQPGGQGNASVGGAAQHVHALLEPSEGGYRPPAVRSGQLLGVLFSPAGEF